MKLKLKVKECTDVTEIELGQKQYDLMDSSKTPISMSISRIEILDETKMTACKNITDTLQNPNDLIVVFAKQFCNQCNRVTARFNQLEAK